MLLAVVLLPPLASVVALIATAPSVPSQPPSGVVRALYAAYGRAGKGQWAWNDRTALGRYFEPQLVELFVKEEACKAKTGEICNLEFDPLSAAQDAVLGEHVVAIRMAKAKSDVCEVVLGGRGRKRTLRYDLRKTDAGWRIADIHYPDGTSLRSLLSQ
jgi:hypothetical protein